MELPAEIEAELSQARDAEKEGNEGKARVCARRAVGKAFALSHYPSRPALSLSTTQILKIISADEKLSEPTREAARRLAASVAENGGASVSARPVQDALLIITGLIQK